MVGGDAAADIKYPCVNVDSMRMNSARVVLLTISVSVGGVAASLAAGSDNKSLPAAPVARMRAVSVPDANSNIAVVWSALGQSALGQAVTPGDLQWQARPVATASSTFIDRHERPEAINVARYGVQGSTTTQK